MSQQELFARERIVAPEFSAPRPVVTVDERPVLRDYQTAAVRSFFAGEERSQLIVLPTGAGKTVIFAAIVREYVERGKRCLVIAHREELIEQAERKLRASHVRAEIEMASSRASRDARCVVASIQSMQKKRLESWPVDHFDLVIVDEFHHATAASYRNLLKHFASAKVLGVTATPERGDKANLSEMFDRLAYQYSLMDAIDDGWLVPIVGVTSPQKISLADLRRVRGDIDPAALEKLMVDKVAILGQIALEHCADLKTMIFTPGVGSAHLLAEWLKAAGVRAESADGSMGSDERSSVLKRFRSGEITHLVNCALFTEGFDEPSIACVYVARPTESRALFLQMVGRGTRLYEGKDRLLLLAPDYSSSKFDVCDPFEIFGAGVGARVIQFAKKFAAKAMGPIDYRELIAQVREWLVKHRETAVLKTNRNGMKLINPAHYMEIEGIPNETDVLGWKGEKSSEGQRKLLYAAGFDWKSVEDMTKGQASALISHVMERSPDGPRGYAARWLAEVATPEVVAPAPDTSGFLASLEALK